MALMKPQVLIQLWLPLQLGWSNLNSWVWERFGRGRGATKCSVSVTEGVWKYRQCHWIRCGLLWALGVPLSLCCDLCPSVPSEALCCDDWAVTARLSHPRVAPLLWIVVMWLSCCHTWGPHTAAGAVQCQHLEPLHPHGHEHWAVQYCTSRLVWIIS